MDKIDDLIDLANLVTKNSIKNIELLGGGAPPKNSKVKKFYDGIADGKFKTDEEAANYFYQSPPKDRRYRDLVERLRDRMLNTLFFIDTNSNKYNTRQKTYYKIIKYLATARILTGKGQIILAVPIIKRTISLASKYHFFDIASEACTLMIHYHGTKNLDRKGFNHYVELHEEYCSKATSDLLSYKYFYDLLIDYHKNRAVLEPLAAKAEQYCAELEELRKDNNSIFLNLSYFMIRLIILTPQRELSNLLVICNEAVQFFDKMVDFEYSTGIQIFLRKKVFICLQLGFYEEGIQAHQRSSSYGYHTDFGQNWFNQNYNYIILLFYTDKFQEAYTVFQEVTKKKHYKRLAALIKEPFKILEAFFHYLLELGIINGEKTKFKLGRFISDIERLSKDVRIANIPILVIEILILIWRRSDNLIDRIEALEKYTSRNLNRKNGFRSSVFIKMILKIPECNYERKASELKAKPYLERLRSVPLKDSEQLHEIEIIPYEKLWEFALLSLEKKID